MTRALLTGCLLGCAVLAGYALGRWRTRQEEARKWSLTPAAVRELQR